MRNLGYVFFFSKKNKEINKKSDRRVVDHFQRIFAKITWTKLVEKKNQVRDESSCFAYFNIILNIELLVIFLFARTKCLTKAT